MIVASFHASPLTATNSLRRKQIEAAHQFVRDLSDEAPAIMVGDFNYPWFQTNLRRKIEEHGFALSLSDQPTYLRYRKFTGHFDFATSVGLHIAGVETLPAGISDHRPILVRAHYEHPGRRDRGGRGPGGPRRLTPPSRGARRDRRDSRAGETCRDATVDRVRSVVGSIERDGSCPLAARRAPSCEHGAAGAGSAERRDMPRRGRRPGAIGRQQCRA